MKHILILEDEQRNANRLVRLLKEIVPEARIDGPLATIEAAAGYLRKAPALDLILADIRLSDGLSFEALKEAPPAVPIIFTSLRRLCRAGVQVQQLRLSAQTHRC